MNYKQLAELKKLFREEDEQAVSFHSPFNEDETTIDLLKEAFDMIEMQRREAGLNRFLGKFSTVVEDEVVA